MAEDIRRSGLPLDHPSDVVYCTAILGEELTRFRFSSSQEILDGTAPEYGEWPTPEPQHRISQIYLEPILHEKLAELASVSVERGWLVESVAPAQDHAVVLARRLDDDTLHSFEAQYVVGCDGGASRVRTSIGATLQGDGKAALERVSVYFRSEELGQMLEARDPGWMYWWYADGLRGSFLQLNGRDLFLCHARVPEGMHPDELSEDLVLDTAIGTQVAHEKLQVVRWTPRRLVSDKFRDGRVIVAGDAAHLWLPLGGFGMNTGIADGVGLAWRLAALLRGWGGDRLLEDYEAERQSVGEATSRAALKIETDMRAIASDADFHADNGQGRSLREAAGELIRETDRQQWFSPGVQFGARYQNSPGVVDWEGAASSRAIERIDEYEPSVRPGGRFPHAWLAGRRSVFDLLGPEFTLITVGAEVDAGPLLKAAADSGVPLHHVSLVDEPVADVYAKRMILVRPDLIVAWSGDELDDDPAALFARLLDLNGRSATAELER
jgi:2-polyprenyl-6-methoxyphenol hydroxylase-like FAD-dependent oxidoreductase